MADDRRDIVRYNERITVQKSAVVSDRLQNRMNAWTDYYSCYAYASTYQFDEEQPKETTSPEQTVSFEVRWCHELRNIDSTHYRILFNGKIYNIISVDMMNYQRRIIRIRSRLEKQGAKP